MTPKGQAALGLTLCFIILSTIVVAMRLYTRYRILRNAGPDDWLVLVAHLCNVALTVTICGQVHFGMGHHTTELSRAYLIGTMKYFYASLPAYYLSLTFTKLSLLLQCFRIFTSADFGMRLASYVLMGLVIGIGIYTVLADILICMPVRRFWDDSVAGYCINEEALWLTNAAFNILTDMAIFLLPIKRVAGLQLAPNKKRLLIVVFGTGFFACIASIIRLRFLIIISNSSDPTFDNSGAAAWSSIEVNVALICACLPSLKPLIAPFVKDMTSGARSGSNTIGTTTIGGGTTRTTRSKARQSRASRFFSASTKKVRVADDEESAIEINPATGYNVGGGGGGKGGIGADATCTADSDDEGEDGGGGRWPAGLREPVEGDDTAIPGNAFEISCRKEWSVTVESMESKSELVPSVATMPTRNGSASTGSCSDGGGGTGV